MTVTMPAVASRQTGREGSCPHSIRITAEGRRLVSPKASTDGWLREARGTNNRPGAETAPHELPYPGGQEAAAGTGVRSKISLRPGHRWMMLRRILSNIRLSRWPSKDVPSLVLYCLCYSILRTGRVHIAVDLHETLAWLEENVGGGPSVHCFFQQ